jgi:hypothetical protein
LLGAASFSVAAEIDVMTQDRYLGAGITPVVALSASPNSQSHVFLRRV